jgi:hypothetical protein
VSVLDELAALGRAVARGERVAPPPARLREEAAAALASFDPAELEDGAVAVAAALMRLDEGTEEAELAALRAEIEPALDRRDEVEHVLLGAEVALGGPARLGADGEAAVAAFDAIVRPLVWKLTALNDVRVARRLRIAPPHRARFYWWCESTDVPAPSVAALSGVAALCARFPEARRAFEEQVAAERLVRSATARRRGAKVTSLRAYLEAKRWRGQLAAADDEETPLLARPEVELSYLPPDWLLVDLLVPPAGPPRVIGAGAERTLEPVEGAVDRFRLALDAELLAAARIRVVVVVETGEVEVELPPDG